MPPSAGLPPIRLFLLGPFRAERGGVPIAASAWQRPRARALIKLLAVEPDHRLHQDQVLDLLWPELDPEAGFNNLRKALHYVRHALQPDLPRRGQSAYLHLIDNVVSLDPDLVWIDADHFERLAERARAGADPALHAAALAAYTADLLPEDRYEDWTEARRGALKHLVIDLLAAAADLHRKRGEMDLAVERLQQALAHDPAHETVHRRLMRLYLDAGRRHEAIRQFRLCREALHLDLGVEPDEETRALYAGIVAGPAAFASAPSPADLSPLPPPIKRAPEVAFVGRDRSLELLMGAIEGVRGGGDGRPLAHLVLVSGEAGVGKTRLTAEAARLAHASGARVLWGASFQQEGEIPYGPFVDALENYLRGALEGERERLGTAFPYLRQLLPSLWTDGGDPPSTVRDVEGERLRLFSAVAQALTDLAAAAPLVVVLDDLHAADAASLQLLHYLARQRDPAPVLLVATYRDDQVIPGGEFERLLAAVTREDVQLHINLLRLAPAECSGLIQTLLPGAVPSPELCAQVYEMSLGNPLFVVELVAAIRQRGELERRNGRWELVPASTGVPNKLKTLVTGRLHALSEDARDTVVLAAVAGMESSFALLQRAARSLHGESWSDGRMLDALDELLRSRVLEEREDGYSFGHPLVRATLYEQASRQRRLLFHGALAGAIEELAPNDAEALAFHYSLSPDSARARSCLERAGDRAASVYAADAALRYYGQALERCFGDVAADARLHEKLGRVLLEAGRLTLALDALEHAAQLYERGDDLHGTARVIAQIATSTSSHGTPQTRQAGLARLDAMIERLQALPVSETLAQLYVTRSGILGTAGRYGESLEAADRACDLAAALGNARLQGEAGGRRGFALCLLGRAAQARQVLEEAIPRIERDGDVLTLYAALNNAATACEELGDLGAAIQYTQRTLQVVERLDNPLHLPWVLANLGMLLITVGDWPSARTTLERAVAVSRDRHPRGEALPQICLSTLTMRQGDFEAARAHAERGLFHAQATGVQQLRDMADLTVAELDLLEGNVSLAIERLQPLVKREATEALPLLARASLGHGGSQVVCAGEAAVAAVERARQDNKQLHLASALLAQGMVLARQGHLVQSQETLTCGLTLSRSLPHPYLEAQILHEMGAVLRGSGQPACARQRFEEALAIFVRLGARRDVETARAVLAEIRGEGGPVRHHVV